MTSGWQLWTKKTSSRELWKLKGMKSIPDNEWSALYQQLGRPACFYLLWVFLFIHIGILFMKGNLLEFLWLLKWSKVNRWTLLVLRFVRDFQCAVQCVPICLLKKPHFPFWVALQFKIRKRLWIEKKTKKNLSANLMSSFLFSFFCPSPFATRRVADDLPRHNKLLLQHLVCVLHHILQNAESNKMDAYNLAVCIAPTLLQLECTPLDEQKEKMKKVRDICYECFLSVLALWSFAVSRCRKPQKGFTEFHLQCFCHLFVELAHKHSISVNGGAALHLDCIRLEPQLWIACNAFVSFFDHL